MSEEAISVEEEKEEENTTSCTNTMSRKEKRKEMKKKKRKQKRKEMAEKEKEEEEAKLNDPEEKRKADLMEQEERERVERERKEFEERERVWVEEMMEKKRKDEQEEEEERRKRHALEEEEKDKVEDENDWEYVEEGPAEIIWQGNEIIVKKKKVKVPKKKAEQRTIEEDADRPTSNPLPPQSEAFLDYKNVSTVSTQEIYDNVAQQVPNFGTELDKAHCPFHIKTGVCRFGQRCSRVHFYPDKSCTLLIKNMYNGPGLAWEQDEGLEFTDEEIERCYEEFYEDVHTEFLKFGELVNFKVCKNGSFHLRGNVYVHYKSLDSAVLACHSLNGRYFAGKQVKFEFVGVTKWKVAICGEYMKSRLKTCSHGTACNFIHCFRNPGGDYEWADWDKPPPKYWVKKMVALFGHSDEFEYENQVEHESFGQLRSSSKMITTDEDRYRSRRSKSRETDGLNRGSGRSHYDKNDARKSRNRHMRKSNDRKRIKVMDDFEYEERTNFRDSYHKSRTHDTDSDGDLSIRDRDRDRDRNRHHGSARGCSRQHNKVLKFTSDYVDNGNDGGHWRKRTNNADSVGYWSDGDRESRRHHDQGNKLSETSSNNGDSEHQISEADPDRVWSDTDRNRDKYQVQRKKSSRHWLKAPGVLDDCGGRRKRTDETDSGGDWSERDRDSKNHNGHRGKSSRDQNNFPRHAEVKGDDRNSNLYSDSSDDWSGKNRENCHRRKRLRNSSQVSEVSDDRWDPE